MVVFCYVRYVYAPRPIFSCTHPSHFGIRYPIVIIVAAYVYNVPRILLEVDILIVADFSVDVQIVSASFLYHLRVLLNDP